MVVDDDEEIVVEEPPEDLPPATTTWIEIGVVFLLAVLPNLFIAFVSRYPRSAPFWYAHGYLAVKSLSVAAPVLYMMWRSGLSWKHYGLGRNRDLTGSGIFFAATLTGVFLMPYVAAIIRPLFTADMEHAPYRPSLPHGGVEWAFLVFSLILNSIAEETAMRGFLTARLFDVTKRATFSCLVSGVLFGLYHSYQGWASACAAAVLGFLFSAMFLSSRRLKALIYAHTVVNIVVFLLYTYKMLT